jgi:hypothetical protein
MEPTVCFVSASSQNVFFGELLDALADALSEHGIAVERAVDHFPDLRDGLAYAFVPHELIPLVMPDAHPSEQQLRRSVAICTEQPGTPWFDHTVQIARRTGASVDINPLGVAEQRKLGIDAAFLQLGYTPLWDRWHGDRELARPVDLSLLAGSTPRRLAAVARSARQLAGRRTELHMPEAFVPHLAESEHFLAGERKWELLSRTRVLMNIHRSELGYFEWQRAIEALANGCVLLSEHSVGFEPLVPGEHFVSVSYDSLDVALGALLADEGMCERIRESAYDFIRGELPLKRSVEVLAEALTDVLRAPTGPVRSDGRVPSPRPKRPPMPPPEFERVAGGRSELDILRMATKQLLLDQREMRKTLRKIETAVEGGGREDLVESFGPERDTPRVSVVVTVYNYAALVTKAIESVAASEFTDYELVIVDDASSDDSGERIREALLWVPWVTAKLVTRGRNEGLAQARNLGSELATGELVFILDADNMIYPHALGRLVRALEEDPTAAFAYGIIEQFGVEGSTGLLSYLEWDPQRLRYGNFIDAMAMMRREALLEAGGYVTDPRLHGWEDFALWCAFASRGWHGARVPEIVARYRVAAHSMISITNIDTSVAWTLLLDRYEFLAA